MPGIPARDAGHRSVMLRDSEPLSQVFVEHRGLGVEDRLEIQALILAALGLAPT